MKAIVITSPATGAAPVGPQLKLAGDWPPPTPPHGHVVVRTEAAALNRLDLFVARGAPGLNLTYPRISGSDGAGIVEAVGEQVDKSWIGKRVALNAAVPVTEASRPGYAPPPSDIAMIGEHTQGCLAEQFVAPASNIVEIGDCDPVHAAAFALTHLTAWRMLITRAQLKPGMWVLITGIGGGVALAALAICRHFGARTIVTSRHQWKLEKAKALGSDHAVLDTGSDWSKEVRALSGRRGVDVAVDSAGKAVHLACIKSLARGGTYVTCGATAGPDATTDLARLFWNQLSILGSTMGDMNEFRQVMALFTAGVLQPVIDSVHAPGEAPAAFGRLESGDQFGKVVIKW